MHRYFSVLGAVWVVIIDRYVKRMVAANLALGETAALLPGFVRLRRVHNYGAAWSSFSGARWLLVGVTAVGLGALAWLLFRIVRHPLGVWSLALVVGGGIGNLVDRLKWGYVVDMLEFEFVSFPVFNVADIFVTCGAAAAAVYYLKYYEKYDAVNWERNPSDGTDASDNGKR
ncbi:MAG: signal peptidase II [Oscillospiraceae bacterium]|nr:signal peptidase II [Oscillospiraceae bacterium]